MSKSPFLSLFKNIPSSASLASDGKSSAEFSGFIDTGSYALNAALSGSIFNGMPDNKLTVFAGESSSGKTYFILGILNNWMKLNPTGVVVYFDTESAVTNKMMEERGLDCSKVIKVEPETIEQFRESAVGILDNYGALETKDSYPMIMVLDSLGNLSSNKEIQDIRDQKDTRDMTKAQLLRGTFRVLRLRLAKLNVPMIVSNHTYAVVGSYVPTTTMSGGGGLKYVSDSIVMLRKSKDKDKDKNVIGNIVHIKMEKSRLSKENSEVEVKISYSGGLDKYHGLLEMAEESGLVSVNMGKYNFPNSAVPVKLAVIEKDPSKFFTPEFLKKLDKEYVVPTFSYGMGAPAPVDTTEELD